MGDDTIYGNRGNGRIRGGEGDDLIFGESGNDKLFGGPDDDSLTGEPGIDTFNCGDGDDAVTDYNPAKNETISASFFVLYLYNNILLFPYSTPNREYI
jgi:Ca2+-binding RTX toxin-like protein